MEKPLRVAVVGAGEIAERAHLPMWARCADTAVTVLADVSMARAEAASARFDVPHATADVESVLNDPDVDIVDICTPPHVHAPLTLRAIEAGKHVLIEKPLAPTMDEATDVADVARKADTVVMVAENWLFASAPRSAQRLIRDHDLGRPFLVKAWHESDLYAPGQRDTPQWTFDPRRTGGGYLLQAGIHTFTLLTHLIDGITEVHAWLRHPDGGGVEDSAVATARLQHGGLAALTFTGASAHPGDRRLGFELFFDDTYLAFDVWSGDITVSRRTDPIPVPAVPRSLGFDEQAAHFVDCIRTGATPVAAPHKVLPALHAVTAAYAAAASGAPVSIKTAEGVR